MKLQLIVQYHPFAENIHTSVVVEDPFEVVEDEDCYEDEGCRENERKMVCIGCERKSVKVGKVVTIYTKPNYMQNDSV